MRELSTAPVQILVKPATTPITSRSAPVLHRRPLWQATPLDPSAHSSPSVCRQTAPDQQRTQFGGRRKRTGVIVPPIFRRPPVAQTGGCRSVDQTPECFALHGRYTNFGRFQPKSLANPQKYDRYPQMVDEIPQSHL